MAIADETQPGEATSGADSSGLILTQLTTKAEQNTAEAHTISLAYDHYIFEARRKKRGARWLTNEFICAVHQDMFGSIWKWAGKYRTENLNIGIDWHLIPEQVRLLCDDFLYWDSLASAMPVLEIAARLQNRLTKIHPFKNGNGRHARLITDMFFYSRNHPLLEWPQTQLMSEGHQIRERYIAAMQKADQGDFSFLIAFFENCRPQSS